MSRRVLRVALWGMFVDQCSHQPYARYFIRRKRPTISRLLGIYATFSEGSKGSKHFNSAALTFRPSGLWVLSRILSSDRPSFAFPPPAPAAEDAHAPTCAFYNSACTCARTHTIAISACIIIHTIAISACIMHCRSCLRQQRRKA